jgi:dihydrofolate reductase
LASVGTYLYGRRLYEMMAYWDGPVESYPPEFRDFAQVWQKAEKIAFSRTLPGPSTRKTRVERDFDAAAIRKLKRETEYDITIGGAELAGLAFEANLVDECHLLVHQVILGGGKPAFRPGLLRKLELLETRRIGTGVVSLRYRVLDATP